MTAEAAAAQVVGFEFLAYQQRVVDTVKAAWTNAIRAPGCVAKRALPDRARRRR